LKRTRSAVWELRRPLLNDAQAALQFLAREWSQAFLRYSGRCLIIEESERKTISLVQGAPSPRCIEDKRGT